MMKSMRHVRRNFISVAEERSSICMHIAACTRILEALIRHHFICLAMTEIGSQ